MMAKMDRRDYRLYRCS